VHVIDCWDEGFGSDVDEAGSKTQYKNKKRKPQRLYSKVLSKY
jgi:hypothetical protein